MSTTAPKTPEQLKKEAEHQAQFRAARNVYLIIVASFLTVCTVAVIITMKTAASQTGFQAIHTSTPIAFFDKTYMVHKKK